MNKALKRFLRYLFSIHDPLEAGRRVGLGRAAVEDEAVADAVVLQAAADLGTGVQEFCGGGERESVYTTYAYVSLPGAAAAGEDGESADGY